jgi:hypothetical protein
MRPGVFVGLNPNMASHLATLIRSKSFLQNSRIYPFCVDSMRLQVAKLLRR